MLLYFYYIVSVIVVKSKREKKRKKNCWRGKQCLMKNVARHARRKYTSLDFVFYVRLCQLNHLRRAALVKISKIIKNWLTVAPQGCTGSQSKQRNTSSQAERTVETIIMEAEAAPIIIIIKVDRPVLRADRRVRTVWGLLRRQVEISFDDLSFSSVFRASSIILL